MSLRKGNVIISGAGKDGKDGADGKNIQYSEMPTPSSTNEGDIIEYIGTTGNGYVNGYFYKCVENSSVYSWVPIIVDKTYVDNKLTTFSGYDPTKIQVLKNVEGVMTWIDEGPTLRNIVVGDNLTGKTLYFTFPETNDFANSLANYVGDNVITFGDLNSVQGWMEKLYIRTISSNRIAIRDGSGAIYQNVIYENAERVVDDFEMDFTGTDIESVDLEVYGINSSNPAYPYIWIEDEG